MWFFRWDVLWVMSIVKVCRYLGKRFLVGLKDCVIYVLLVSS